MNFEDELDRVDPKLLECSARLSFEEVLLIRYYREHRGESDIYECIEKFADNTTELIKETCGFNKDSSDKDNK